MEKLLRLREINKAKKTDHQKSLNNVRITLVVEIRLDSRSKAI